MAELTAKKQLFDGRGGLPMFCMSCGKPADSIYKLKVGAAGNFVNASDAAVGDDLGIGCLLSAVFVLIDVCMLAKHAARRRITVHAPLCRHHRWIVRHNIVLKAEDETTVTLDGVAPEFIEIFNKSFPKSRSKRGKSR